jgi:hypothetical protein
MTRFALFTLLLLASRSTAADSDWVEPMKKVHSKFSGTPGTLALLGDSITYSLGFWAPLEYAPKTVAADIGKPIEVVKGYMKPDCWRKWRGPEYGNESGKTIVWASEKVDDWLKKVNPEVAVLMFGTNDLNGVEAKEFEVKTRAVVERCLKNGTIVILTTLPPRSGVVEKAKKFAEVQRMIAADLKVPLVDYQAEILKRRPNDWDGTLAKFKESAADVYQVPTLIAADGVHPSNPKMHQDYSEDALDRNGYQLRNVLTVKAYSEVIRLVLKP